MNLSSSIPDSNFDFGKVKPGIHKSIRIRVNQRTGNVLLLVSLNKRIIILANIIKLKQLERFVDFRLQISDLLQQ